MYAPLFPHLLLVQWTWATVYYAVIFNSVFPLLIISSIYHRWRKQSTPLYSSTLKFWNWVLSGTRVLLKFWELSTLWYSSTLKFRELSILWYSSTTKAVPSLRHLWYLLYTQRCSVPTSAIYRKWIAMIIVILCTSFIFHFLKQVLLFNPVSRVCTEWRKVAKEFFKLLVRKSSIMQVKTVKKYIPSTASTCMAYSNICTNLEKCVEQVYCPE